MTLKTVFFDIGNVLFFFNQEKMFEQIAECSGLSSYQVKSLLLEEGAADRYEEGRIDTLELFSVFKKRSEKSFSLPEFLEAASNIFTPNFEAWAIVEKLKKANIRLVLLSNTNECHFNRLYSHYPILPIFDHKILSFEVGSMKPKARIFEKALLSAHCDPQECFYTDDLEENIFGARRAGLDSEVFKDAPSLEKHLLARGCPLPDK